MPKINGAGEPTFADARGTDATAVNARDELHYLDPTAHVDDEGKLVDNDDLVIEGDEREQYETREEREQRETREREEAARAKTAETLDDAKAHERESGDFEKNKAAGGPTPADVAKQAANEKDSSEVTPSAGTSSKASSKQSAKTTGNN